jgi:FkbM family methyltransferase
MGIWRASFRSRVKPLVYRYRSRFLYRLANFYVNAVDNDNDSDFKTNGEERFAQTMLRGASTAFDVGAAKGDWTAIALAAEPKVVVHAFEPTTRRFEVLRKRDFGERAILNQLGLGDALKELDIFYGASGGSNSLFPQRPEGDSYAPTDTEKIKITTIDQYCAERGIKHVDFIKMDIEGYEMAAIRGAERMLRSGEIETLQFEYSAVFLDAGASLLGLMQYMREINPAYEFHKILPDGTKRISSYEHAIDNFKTQNWALIKRS